MWDRGVWAAYKWYMLVSSLAITALIVLDFELAYVIVKNINNL